MFYSCVFFLTFSSKHPSISWFFYRLRHGLINERPSSLYYLSYLIVASCKLHSTCVLS